jgi:signal transduction histidine kinase
VAGMNIYRIIQEAVNNSLKYANASLISVHISEVDETFNIEIKDNGTGFNSKEVEMGHGLSNMKKRAREIHAELSIDSKINEGTHIHLQLPKQ